MRRPSSLMQRSPDRVEPPPAITQPPANYLDLYGLSRPPFGVRTDNDGYILFDSHRRTFELLLDHMINGRGLVLLRGEEGVGKSQMLTAARNLAAENALRIIQPPTPKLGRLDLPRLLAAILDNASAAGKPTEPNVQAAIASFQTPPRAVLLLDDLNRLTGGCLSALAAIVQSETPPATVVTITNDQQTSTAQADLIRLAIKELTVPRLGPAETRQYIERSLWLAGSTTRRLIAADALRMIVASSNGVPGSIDRLMETILTAGFARGDSLITAKTVAATLAPAQRRLDRPNWLATVAPIIGIGLLLIGTVAFLYRGLTGEPEQPTPQPVVAEQKPGPPPSSNPDLLAALLKLGDQTLLRGDLAAARLVYQRTAEAGSAAAATAMARTFDPAFQPNGADPGLAAQWYQKAISLGDQSAADLLKRLQSRQTAIRR
jgi:type II secretory pathway predicted ATPase ExeA